MPGSRWSMLPSLPTCGCMPPQRSTRWMPLASMQQLVADRRAPVHGDEALQRETAVVAGLGRGDGPARSRADAGRARAEVLLVERHSELVLRCRLPREPGLVDGLLLMEDRLVRRRHVVEAVQLVGVQVEEGARDVVVCKERSPRQEEPELVALDRTAKARIEVAVRLDGAGNCQPTLLARRCR